MELRRQPSQLLDSIELSRCAQIKGRDPMVCRKSLVLAVAVGMFSFAANALAENNLFKNYVYDSSVDSYKTAEGYYDCSAEVGGTAWCIDDVEFIGNKFTAALIFSEGKLMTVSLLSPFDQALYTKAFATLSKTFTLISMTDEKSILDLVDLVKKSKSKEDYLSVMSNYESVGVNAGSMTYTFLEGVKPQTNLRSAVSMLASASESVRSVDLVLTGQGTEAFLIMRFSFPKLEISKVVKASKEPVEEF